MSLDNMKSLLKLFESAEQTEQKQIINEDRLPDHLDPNLSKAYNLGNEAYLKLKNHPELAQAAQDKIEAEFPQYAKMWLTGYRDGERFDKSGVSEGSENLAIGEKMARDGIEYDPAREGEIISMIGDYLKRDGMTARQIRGYMMDNDFVSDQLSYLPRKSGVAEGGDPNRFDPRASRKHPGAVDVAEDDKSSKQEQLARLKEKLEKLKAMSGSIVAIGKQDLERKIKKLDIDDATNENFGGGMRDRPGPDHKSFDLAECREFLKKRL